jgi:hypothetical protein
MATLKKNNGSKSKKDVSNSSTLSKDSATTAVPQNGEQQRMVSEAAYYRAMSRDFEGGDPVEDWLEAKRELTTKLSAE